MIFFLFKVELYCGSSDKYQYTCISNSVREDAQVFQDEFSDATDFDPYATFGSQLTCMHQNYICNGVYDCVNHNDENCGENTYCK